MATFELSRSLARALRRYAGKVEAVREAESNYQDALSESRRKAGKAKGKARRRIDAAFDALVDAVVELQRGQYEVVVLAEGEGLAPSSLGALDTAFGSADRDYAGYLAARTYGQVRAAVAREPAFR